MLHIRHWKRQYRLSTPHVLPYEQLAQGPVLAAFEAALRERLPQEQELLFVRDVTLRLTTADSGHLAEDWGRAMAQTVVAAVEQGDTQLVRRFADEDDYVAQFLAAVLSGAEDEAWYFHRLRQHHRADTPHEFDALLSDRVVTWRGLMHRLNDRGLLLSVLRRISPELQDRLWHGGLNPLAETLVNKATTASERPLFAAAMQLIETLCQVRLTATECEAAWLAFVDTGTAQIHWSDTVQLAARVAEAVSFLRQRYAPIAIALERLATLSDTTSLQNMNSVNDPLVQRITAAVQQFDWLDQGRLAQLLESQIRSRQDRQSSSADPIEKRQPTAHGVRRLEQWRQQWADLEQTFLEQCKQEHWSRAGQRLLATALLLERLPELAHEPNLAQFIEQQLQQLEQRGLDLKSSTTLNESSKPVNPPVLKRKRATPVPPHGQGSALEYASNSAGTVTQTPLAGTFLLLRAMQDLRLWGLARQAEFAANEPLALNLLLHHLAIRWAGVTDLPTTDPGLAALYSLAGVPLAEGIASHGSGAGIDSHNFTFADPVFQQALENQAISLGTWTSVSDLRQSLSSASQSEGLATISDPILLDVTAEIVVRHWARSLKTMSDASTPYLLQHFIRRSGSVTVQPGRLVITLEPRPLDVVLQVSGLLDPLDVFTGSQLISVVYQIVT